MKRVLRNTDITTVAADALIYSTNVNLMLSGGVGACLLKKFGNDFQDDLYRQLGSSNRRYAEVGEIFISNRPGDPWHLIVHTIATDPMYHTKPETVSSLVSRFFDICSSRADVRSLVMSPLGAGYGDLDLPLFLKIVSEVTERFEHTDIAEVIICCDYEPSYRELVVASESINTQWEQEG
ncbi:macro domain-containing protein [Luteolibacter algae]|uniref:Macro domain-containing protein n=1 Tax=Luteolibacter algae TaxID=454151 RepID=A0ABW5D9M0_9BACT